MKKRRDKLTGDLVTHILGFEAQAGNDAFKETVSFCLENFDGHHFPGTQWRVTSRDIQGLITKFSIHNEITRSEGLKNQYEKYIQLVPSTDESFDILRLLKLLSYTHKADVVATKKGHKQQTDWTDLDSLNKRQQIAVRLTAELVAKTIGFQPGNQHYAETLCYCMDSFENHGHLNMAKADIRRSMAGIYKKIKVDDNEPQKAMDFKQLFQAYESGLPEVNNDNFYKIIHFLVAMVKPSRPTGNSRKSPLKLIETRAPVKELTYEDITDDYCRALDREWREDYEQSLNEERRHMFASKKLDQSLAAVDIDDSDENFQKQKMFEETDFVDLFRASPLKLDEEVLSSVDEPAVEEEALPGDTTTEDKQSSDVQLALQQLLLNEHSKTIATVTATATASAALLSTSDQDDFLGGFQTNEKDLSALGREGTGVTAFPRSFVTFDTAFDTLGTQQRIAQLDALPFFERPERLRALAEPNGHSMQQQPQQQQQRQPAQKSWNELHDKLQAHFDEKLRQSKRVPHADCLRLAPAKVLLEASVVHCCVSVLRGIASDVFRFDHNGNRFVTTCGLAVASLSEASLHSSLEDFVRSANERYLMRCYINRHTAAETTAGQCFQAFAASLSRLLERLELRLTEFDIAANATDSAQPVTLVALWQWVVTELTNLTFLFHFLEKIIDTAPETHHLLSLLYNGFLQSNIMGNPRQTTMCLFMFTMSLMPYLQMLDKWVRLGIVEDPYGEFMIIESCLEEKNSSSYWSKGFTIRMDNRKTAKKSKQASEPAVPVFLMPFAKKILLTGRALHMIELVSQAAGLRALGRKSVVMSHAHRRKSVVMALGQDAAARLAHGESAPIESSKALEELFWLSLSQLANKCSKEGFSQPPPTNEPMDQTATDTMEYDMGSDGDGVGVQDDTAQREQQHAHKDFVKEAQSLPRLTDVFAGLVDKYSSSSEQDIEGLMASMTTYINVNNVTTTKLSLSPSHSHVDGIERVGDGYVHGTSSEKHESFHDYRLLGCFVGGPQATFVPNGLELLPTALFTHLEEGYLNASRYLKNLLMKNCFLMEHIMALRDGFFLADQEVSKDLTQAIQEQLETWSQKKTEAAARGSVIDAVFIAGLVRSMEESIREAFRSSSGCDKYLADSLSLTIDPAVVDGDTWYKGATGEINLIQAVEHMHFETKMPWAINTIIDEDACEHYNRILRFLIQVSHGKQLLESMQGAGKQLRDKPLNSTMHHFFLLKHQVYHFVSSLHSYIMYRAVDSVWDDFKNKFGSALTSDVDELRGWHADYLKQIQNLLIIKYPLAQRAIHKMLNICVSLKNIHQQFLTHLEEDIPDGSSELERRKLAELKLSRKLTPLSKDFRSILCWLLLMLTKTVENGYFPHLEDVLTRLNFNQYWSKELEEAASRA